MSTFPMIAVPSKKTEKIDLVPPIQSFILATYGNLVLQDHVDHLSDFNQMREVLRTHERSEQFKDTYTKYLDFLNSLELRLPINESNIKIPFIWFDAVINKKLVRYTIPYERNSVLFNFGALYSQLGAIQNRDSEDGVKKASFFFQTAAGAFSTLKENLLNQPIDGSTLDFMPEFASALINLMLGQAQECFFEKAQKSRMKEGILAKLLMQVVEYYEAGLHLLTNPLLKSSVEKYLNWILLTQLKVGYLKASVHHLSAISAHETDKYGAEVMHLSMAINLLDNLKKTVKIPVEHQESINKLSAVVAKAFSVANSENNRIYHEPVPTFTANMLESKSLVKQLPLPKQPDFRDPFARLIPISALHSASVYTERKAELVRKEMNEVETHDQLANSVLANLDITSAIQALESPTGIPQDLQEKIYNLQKAGGSHKLAENLDTVTRESRAALEMLNQSIHLLDLEENEDKDLRLKYGDRWTRTPSSVLTDQLRKEEEVLRSKMSQAAKSDEFIRRKYSEDIGIITTLTNATSAKELLEVRGLAAPLNFSSSSQGNPHPFDDPFTKQIVSELKEKKQQIDTLITIARPNLLAQLKHLAERDDISSNLVGKLEAHHDQVFNEELEKYQPILNQLRENYAAQENLLREIKILNEKFVSLKITDKNAAQMGELIQIINRGCNSFTELDNFFSGGIKFYRNLIDVLLKLKHRTEDLVFARKTEMQELLSAINYKQSYSSGPSQSQNQNYGPTNGLQYNSAASSGAPPSYYPQGQPQHYQQYQPQPPQYNYSSSIGAPSPAPAYAPAPAPAPAPTTGQGGAPANTNNPNGVLSNMWSYFSKEPRT
eukprot:TRINITY_DN10131_c0_g1_i1.p1 TRINITY_DN10131_c0_g1~~TRINITY_DN10131_c0_g1_i1.p1  ORF type:complete len:834 (+),score=215.16 TRINITY_DN10131_c0_g1_i1:95-2596(+)